VETDLAQGTGQTGLVQETGQIDLAQGTGRIDPTDPVQETVQATDLLLEAEIVQVPDQVHARVPDRDRAPERNLVRVRVQDRDQAHVQVRDKDPVLERGRAQDRVQEQDQVHDQVQWIDRGQDQVQGKQAVPEPVVEVPWAATRVGVLLPGTVSVVDQVVLVNQEHAHHGVRRAGVEVEADQRAEAVAVAVAEVVVVAVDVDLNGLEKHQS